MLNFTVDSRLEWAFNCYLHGIGFIVLPLNFFTFYLIIDKTPKHSHSYRVYVLHMQFWTSMLDLHVGLLFMPMPLFPLVGGYCSGLLCRAGLPMHYSIVILFLVLCSIYISFGMSIIYRHQLILPHGHWMRMGRAARSLLFFLTALGAQSPTITAALASVDHAAAEQYLRVNHPAMLWISSKPIWTVYDPFAFPLTWIYPELVVLVLLYPTSYCLITVHLYSGISKANFLSLKTRNLHKHIVTVLIIQVCTFSIFLLVPVSVLIYSTLAETMSHEVNLLFFALMLLYSWSHSLVLIVTTPPYRAVLTDRFCASSRSIELLLNLTMSSGFQKSDCYQNMNDSIAEPNLNANVALSNFESLPRELVWKIIEYAPEYVQQLRLVSNTIKSAVDAYVLQPASTIMLIDGIEYEEYEQAMAVSIFVSDAYADLFEQRLKQRDPTRELVNQIDRKLNPNDVREYTFNFLFLHDNEDILGYVGECAGRRIGKVKCTGPFPSETLPKIVHGMRFSAFWLSSDIISKEGGIHLLEFVKGHQVECLTLFVKMISDPVNFLLELSYIVQALHIKQIYYAINGAFLGAKTVEWAPLFIHMLSRRLDKLRISNTRYREYLSASDQIILQEKLPMLGKPIWFAAACLSHVERLPYVMNEHSIFANANFLMVKHSSKIDEPLGMY